MPEGWSDILQRLGKLPSLSSDLAGQDPPPPRFGLNWDDSPAVAEGFTPLVQQLPPLGGDARDLTKPVDLEKFKLRFGQSEEEPPAEYGLSQERGFKLPDVSRQEPGIMGMLKNTPNPFSLLSQEGEVTVTSDLVDVLKKFVTSPVEAMGRIGGAMRGQNTYPIDEINDPATVRQKQAEDVIEALGAYAGPGILTGKPSATALRLFGGPGAQKANTRMRDVAELALNAGKPPEEVWKATGWKKGADNKWRFEIDDSKMKFKGNLEGSSTIKEKVDHPELFNNYPEINDVPTFVTIDPKLDKPTGYFHEYDPKTGYAGELVIKAPSEDLAKDTLIHEVQHYIQKKEGFAKGGNPKQFSTGEAVRARDVLNWRKEIDGYIEKNWPQAENNFETRLNADNAIRQEYYRMGAHDWVPERSIIDEALSPKFNAGKPDRTKYESIIQEYGLDKKTTPDSEFKMYQKLHGEQEARDAAGRRTWDADMRREVMPEYSKDAIMRFDDGTLAKQTGGAVDDLTKPSGIDYGHLIKTENDIPGAIFDNLDPAKFTNYQGKDKTPTMHNSLVKLDEFINAEKIRNAEVIKASGESQKVIGLIESKMNKLNEIIERRYDDSVTHLSRNWSATKSALDTAAMKFDNKIQSELTRGAKFTPYGNKYRSWSDFFSPDQVTTVGEKVEGFNGMLSTGGPAAELSRPAPVWRSQMQDVLAAKLPGKAEASQMAQTIEAFAKKGEFKPEELEWSGVKEWLAGKQGKVTKQEVTDFISENNVQVKEVVKGQPDKLSKAEKSEMIRLGLQGKLTAKQKERYNELNKKELGAPTKFETYQTPGGENYREMLLTLPDKRKGTWLDGSPITAEDLSTAEGRATAERVGMFEGEPFRSTHYDEPNILAHIRFNDRVDADGKKVLFLEEVQSDWAQKGRKEGFADPNKKRVAVKRQIGDQETVASFSTGDEAQKYIDAHPEERLTAWVLPKDSGVPPAPFVKDTGKWSMLAMKRMVRYAAENGYDRIAWTTGDMQAFRYKEALLKEVDEVAINKNKSGLYDVTFAKNGREVMDEKAVKGERIQELLGKAGNEVLEKADAADGKLVNIPVESMTIGGEGMRGYYDKILPSEVNKFFGKAQWGNARVGESWIPGETDVKKMSTHDLGNAPFGYSVHALDITPQMKAKAVGDGMPLFASGQGATALNALKEWEDKQK